MSRFFSSLLFSLKLLLFALLLSAPFYLFIKAPALSQDVQSHVFANRSAHFGIPNCSDVLSNLPFFALASLGLYFLFQHKFSLATKGEETLLFLFFLSIVFVGIGSTFYHLQPDNFRLLFDRLPIAVSFASLFSLLFMRKIHQMTGLLLAPLFLLAALWSVFYWYYTELAGDGDLKPYYLVQTVSLLSLPLYALLFPRRCSKESYLLLAFFGYLLALAADFSDYQIFEQTRYLISGHTIKHLLAAASVGAIIVYFAASKEQRSRERQ